MISRAQDAWNKIALLPILDKAYKGAPDLIDNFAIQKLSFLIELHGRRVNLNAAYYRLFRHTWGPYSAGEPTIYVIWKTSGFSIRRAGNSPSGPDSFAAMCSHDFGILIWPILAV